MNRRPNIFRADRRVVAGLLASVSALALGATTLPGAQASTPARSPGGDAGASAPLRPDNRPGPLTKRQEHLQSKAMQMLADGTATVKSPAGGGATVKVGKGGGGGTDYVEFPVNRTDTIWTVLGEFSDLSHNSIAEPDRSVDNSTYWEPDFSRAYYDNLFNGTGESMRDFYRKQSSGRYDLTNKVEDWVTVPGQAADYGNNRVEDSGGTWQFLADTVNAWYAAQKAAGKSDAELNAYLAGLDVWDRYDFDADGNFNEADGYIDHFQAVHAGEGEEGNGGADAIWSHRWYAFPGGYGTSGPTVAGKPNLGGGLRIGSSDLWIGDYTVEPENGGLGVFAHEYGHDLGLPDFYDLVSGENSSAFWTLMSAGSWLGHGAAAGDGIGTIPGFMGPQEKLDLLWLDYTEVNPGQSGSFTLGPAARTSKSGKQAIKVNLPDKSTTTQYATPPEGTHAWWTGRGDNLSNTLTRSVPGASSVTVTASAWYDIESGYDYLYGEYSTDNGATWKTVGQGIDGSSNGRWATLRFSYRPGGQPTLFRFRYATDSGYNLAGAFLDQIAVKADTTTFTDGAESGTNGWTALGWKISTGTETVITPLYYLLENRQYVDYDDTLRTGPYQFDRGLTAYNHVEFFAFRPGMLVWMVDQSQADNNTSQHPGEGLALPVDARPAPFTYPDGTYPSNRRQPFDATFGLAPVPQTCLHKEVRSGNGPRATIDYVAACAPANPGIATFDDSDPLRYWSAADPTNSVKVAGAGVRATVTGESGGFLTVNVTNP
jgi:immune inhibitor A